MHRRNVSWRRLAFALAVPVVAVGAVALTAGVAASSTGAATAVRTEQPNQQLSVNPNIPKLPGGSSFKVPPFSFKTLSPKSPPSGSKSGSPSMSKSASASPSGRVSVSPSPSPSPGAPGGTVLVPVPVVVPGGGGAAGACQAPMSPPVTVKVGTAGGKQALVDQTGCALYLFNKDTPTSSACDAACLQLWPVVPGPAQPGSGVDQSKLSVFNRTDGTVQATYWRAPAVQVHGGHAARGGQRPERSAVVLPDRRER